MHSFIMYPIFYVKQIPIQYTKFPEEIRYNKSSNFHFHKYVFEIDLLNPNLKKVNPEYSIFSFFHNVPYFSHYNKYLYKYTKFTEETSIFCLPTKYYLTFQIFSSFHKFQYFLLTYLHQAYEIYWKNLYTVSLLECFCYITKSYLGLIFLNSSF